MSSNKAIIGLQKQNDGIYSSLNTRGIHIERIVISEGINEDEHLNLLKEENTKLKELANANKPIQQPKEEKKKQEPIQQQTQTKKESKPKDNDEEDDEETFEEPIKKFDTITNMEELKRAFFSGNYETFSSEIKVHPFKFYKVEYKYDSDKDGVPDFSAKNLLKGFVRNFDDYRKYFMVCFRCWKYQYETKYKYESLWIVNTNEKIANVIGSMEEDFIFNEITDIDDFISLIKKIPETDSDEPVYINEYTCIGESYVH
jgi:hypothetical protein